MLWLWLVAAAGSVLPVTIASALAERFRMHEVSPWGSRRELLAWRPYMPMIQGSLHRRGSIVATVGSFEG